MINMITGVLSDIVDFILTPIDLLINAVLPDLTNVFQYIYDLFDIVFSSASWVVSLTGLSATAISLIIAYYTFKLTAPLLVYTYKLILNWYDKIRG